MKLPRALSPIIKVGSVVGPIAGNGLYEIANKKPLDVAIMGNPWVWAWAAGVLFGYLLWEISHWEDSDIRRWIQGFFVPLSFEVDKVHFSDNDGFENCCVIAKVTNLSRKKRKNVCLVARKVTGCPGVVSTDIEFCVDVASRAAGQPVFLFEVRHSRKKGKTEFRPHSAYKKSDHINDDWCELKDGVFEFQPCFSDDTQEEICLRLCTVKSPMSNNVTFGLVENYYAETDNPS